jgi:hypothetical protein
LRTSVVDEQASDLDEQALGRLETVLHRDEE